MTGLWLLQLHIMLSQKGRGGKRKGRGREQGSRCCSRQLPHINLMHPSVRPTAAPFVGSFSSIRYLCDVRSGTGEGVPQNLTKGLEVAGICASKGRGDGAGAKE